METKNIAADKIVSFSPFLKNVNDTMMQLFPGVKLETVPIDSIEEEKLKAVRDATILFGDFRQLNHIDRKIIEAAPNLKLIQQPTVGYEAIDVKAAFDHDVPVCNAAGFNSVGVAEHAVMMMLALLRKLPTLHSETSKCNWLQVKCVSEGSVWELEGRNLGILGFGVIGRELAKRARGFGPKILYNKRNRLTENDEKKLGVEYRSFNDILSESDILSVHVPLTEETKGLIGKEEIGRMKKGAILLNLARGEVVETEALAEALRSGVLRGAGVDVFDPEPIEPSNPLIGLENVILTPHIAGGTAESKVKSLKICFDNIAKVIKGETPVNIVNN